jgi:hypothetical protein
METAYLEEATKNTIFWSKQGRSTKNTVYVNLS